MKLSLFLYSTHSRTVSIRTKTVCIIPLYGFIFNHGGFSAVGETVRCASCAKC
uniref:Uncharacterized protein n=1 Tax=Ascaris lumbricoides TaxID=6252 RepID=A0A0M3ISN6_ASCLU